MKNKIGKIDNMKIQVAEIFRVYKKVPIKITMIWGGGDLVEALILISNPYIIGNCFCAYNGSLNRRHLKSALLAVAWNADDWTFDALEAHYKALVRYLNFEDMGMVLGYGCGTPAMTLRSKYPEQAYRLGKSL